MSSRITSAISTRRARETLVNLLFHPKRRVERYSYATLREAYLNKVHKLHPDKHYKQQSGVELHAASSTFNEESRTANAKQFIELKNAWEEYDRIMKQQRLVTDNKCDSSGDKSNSAPKSQWEEDEGSFTMFGVGCSFADSPEEREYRNEIMEQACRGWFSSGSLSNGISFKSKAADVNGVGERKTEIMSDNLFVEKKDEMGKLDRRKNLVQGLDRFRKR